MARVLILEDKADRMVFFRKKFRPDTKIVHVEHAYDAIEELKKHEFDLICLDHDLGGKEMEWDEEDCGMVVAEWISENLEYYNVIIHSFNEPAAKRMMQVLPMAKYIPGVWL